jgi:hypothetical protein
MIHSLPFPSLSAAATFAMLAAGCASYPLPVQHMADAEAAARSARDTGAPSTPQAQLHLKLAEEGIAQAKQLIQDGDNKRADSILTRAKSDAELALGEAREQQAQAAARSVMQQIADLSSNNSAPVNTVTTTSSTVTTTPSPPPPSPPPPSSTTTTTTTTGGKP